VRKAVKRGPLSPRQALDRRYKAGRKPARKVAAKRGKKVTPQEGGKRGGTARAATLQAAMPVATLPEALALLRVYQRDNRELERINRLRAERIVALEHRLHAGQA